MLRKNRNRMAARHAPVFAALGDETRLVLVAKLAGGQSLSISHLTLGSRLTRQAITKHLRVLEGAGVVRCSRSGRERLYELNPRPLDDMRAYLDFVSQLWDEALARFKNFVETE